MLHQNREVLREHREDPCLVQDLQGHHSEYQNLSGPTSTRGFYLMFYSPWKQTFKCGEGMVIPSSYAKVLFFSVDFLIIFFFSHFSVIQPSQCWIL